MIERIAFTPRWLVLAQETAGEEKAGNNSEVREPAGKGARRKAADRPVYFLRVGSIIERDQFEAELEGRYAAGQVLSFQLLEAAVGGVRALLGEAAAEIEDLLRADFGRQGGEADQLSAQDRAKLKGALEILARGWPEYAALVEREARRNAILPTLAFVRWCDGWENVADREGALVAYERDELDELSDHVLRRLDVMQLRSAGLEAYAMQYGRGHAKN